MAISKEATEGSVAHHDMVVTDDKIGFQPEVKSLENEITAYESRHLDFKTVMAILALAFSYEASLFSFVLPAAVLLTINNEIGPSTQITWIATSWSLGGAVTQTIAGRCSDIFGRRNFFIGANILGLIGCAIGSRANTVNTAIAGAALMGIASGPQQLAYAGSSEIVPRKNRGQAAACISFASLPGSTFGSVIAYALVAHLSWRWTFYLGIIANGVALVLTTIFYWPPGFIGLHPEGKSKLEQFKELDFIGLLLFGGGLTSFLLGVSWGGASYPWQSAHVLGPLIVGALTFMVAFPLWEIFSSDKVAKLCPPHLFTNVRGFTIPVAVIIASGMALISLQVLWPQEIQLLFTTVPEKVGWYSLAYNASATAGVIVGGSLFAVIRRTKYQFLAAVVLQTIFISLMATVNQYTPARAIVFVAIASFTIGASQIMAILIVQFGAKDKDIGVATGVLGSARSTGGAIAIAVYSSLLNSKVSQDLAPTVAAAATRAGLPVSSVGSFVVALTSGSEAALAAVKGITPAIIAAGNTATKDVYASGFRLIFLVSLAFAGTACIGAAFVNSVDDELTKQVAVKVDAPHLLHGKGEAKVLGNEKV